MTAAAIGFSFLVIILFSGNASASSAPEEPIDLNQALAEAASGSVTALMQLGRSGGEGAWFALAAAADEAGYDTLVEDLRKRSAEEDAAPYGLLSLSSLLSENPEVFPAPLRVLRRAERRVRRFSTEGSIEAVDLRPARIAVFAYLGREKALSKEMENYLGESYEAPYLQRRFDRIRRIRCWPHKRNGSSSIVQIPGHLFRFPLGRPRTWVRDMPNCSGPDDYMHKPNMPPH
jgi:hypothetical protein